jgi:hypothetical protein
MTPHGTREKSSYVTGKDNFQWKEMKKGEPLLVDYEESKKNAFNISY